MSELFVSRAFCYVKNGNEMYLEGMRGAYVNIVCKGAEISDAVVSISRELAEIDLSVVGFDFIFDQRFLDRALSQYEIMLVSKLHEYPVQYKDVHYFPFDA